MLGSVRRTTQTVILPLCAYSIAHTQERVYVDLSAPLEQDYNL